VYGELVKALTKNSYWFLNFSDRPFKSCDFLNFTFCLIKWDLNWTDFAPRRIPIWNPVRSFMYIECSLPDSWFPGRQLIGILSANGRIKTVGVQDTNGILCANDRFLLVSGKEQQHSKLALLSG
jgi:hypothetical protein